MCFSRLIWTRMELYGLVCPSISPSVCLSVILYELELTRMDSNGPERTRKDPNGLEWTRIDSRELEWNFNFYAFVWTRLAFRWSALLSVSPSVSPFVCPSVHRPLELTRMDWNGLVWIRLSVRPSFLSSVHPSGRPSVRSSVFPSLSVCMNSNGLECNRTGSNGLEWNLIYSDGFEWSRTDLKRFEWIRVNPNQLE